MPINREEVRIAVMELGYAKASEKLDIKQPTLRQWARRFGWHKPFIHSQAVTTVTKPVDAIVNELQTHERETRLSLARSARKLATEAENAELGQSGHALNVGKLAGIVHKWGDEKQNVSFSLNVLNLNMLTDTEE